MIYIKEKNVIYKADTTVSFKHKYRSSSVVWRRLATELYEHLSTRHRTCQTWGDKGQWMSRLFILHGSSITSLKYFLKRFLPVSLKPLLSV